MVKGSCVCGQSAYEWTGDYQAFVRPPSYSKLWCSQRSSPQKASLISHTHTQIACHCIPCRKSSGADRSLNFAIKTDTITVAPSSPQRKVARKGDSGKDLTYHQCAHVGDFSSQPP